jgi:hypothetical protein
MNQVVANGTQNRQNRGGYTNAGHMNGGGRGRHQTNEHMNASSQSDVDTAGELGTTVGPGSFRGSGSRGRGYGPIRGRGGFFPPNGFARGGPRGGMRGRGRGSYVIS